MLLTYFNYQPGETQSEFALTGISLMLTVIPGAFHALMGLLMFKYKISDRVYEEIKQALPEQAHFSQTDANLTSKALASSTEAVTSKTAAPQVSA